MRRRIFLSFQHEDRQQASGFNLLQWNPNVDFDFVERHLLSPADSTDQDYIRSRIREELNGTSVTIVLVGQRTAESEWVDFEIRESRARGNGLLGIRLKDSEESPVPAALEEAEARVIEWNPSHFSDEIERAALIAGRPDLGPPAAQAPASPGRDCAR